MNTEISPENEQFIQHVLATGLYQDRSKVLDDAVTLLKRRQELLDHVDEGVRQLRDGERSEYDDDSLRERFQTLEQRIARRISNHQVGQ